jgi:hypothetical protein
MDWARDGRQEPSGDGLSPMGSPSQTHDTAVDEKAFGRSRGGDLGHRSVGHVRRRHAHRAAPSDEPMGPQTNAIERVDNTRRQRVSRVGRATVSSAKKPANHRGAIKPFIGHFDRTGATASHGYPYRVTAGDQSVNGLRGKWRHHRHANTIGNDSQLRRLKLGCRRTCDPGARASLGSSSRRISTAIRPSRRARAAPRQ